MCPATGSTAGIGCPGDDQWRRTTANRNAITHGITVDRGRSCAGRLDLGQIKARHGEPSRSGIGQVGRIEAIGERGNLFGAGGGTRAPLLDHSGKR